MVFKICILFVIPCLYGCVGSKILYQDHERPKGTPQPLVQVPERPGVPDQDLLDRDEQQLKKLYDQNISKLELLKS